MRILAKKPDYYDMVSHLFGRDPSITYHRKDFECKEILMHINAYENHCYARNMREGNVLCHSYYSIYTRDNISWNTVVAGQNTFKVGSKTEKGKKSSILEFSDVLSDSEKTSLLYHVGVPVFTISRVERTPNPGWVKITVDGNIPILKDLGISKLITAEQMWQSIYHCITNVLRKNPDKQPPVTVSNQERIWASGFDEKMSFRHRK